MNAIMVASKAAARNVRAIYFAGAVGTICGCIRDTEKERAFYLYRLCQTALVEQCELLTNTRFVWYSTHEKYRSMVAHQALIIESYRAGVFLAILYPIVPHYRNRSAPH
jgi:hypothetical protein